MSKGLVKLRRGLASAWAAANTLLLDGELAVDKTNGRLKVGNGSTPWNSLPYMTTMMIPTSGTPSNSIGVDGDFATDTVGKMIYGPKAGGVWPSGVSLAGSQGPQGPSVSDGNKGDILVSNAGATWRLTDSLYAAGAVGNGTADDRAAFVSLDGSLAANHGIFVDGGRYRIGSNLTITRPLMFSSGGRIVVTTGVTVTINAPISAECEQIFELEGTAVVVVNPRFQVERYAEWWGAVINADCAIPFAQAIVAGSLTNLQARDYNTTATMQVPAYAMVQGAGCHYEGDGTATRVLMIGGTNTIVQLGSSTASPPDLNGAPCGATVMDVYFGRNAAPNANSIGALIGWSRTARMERCRVTNSIFNYRVKNAISPFIVDCYSKRDTAIASGQGADKFVGYHLDGTGTLPAAGGNASVWLTRPQVELNLTITDSTAYLIEGRFTDTFVTQPESLGTNYGIDVLGDKAGSPAVGSNCNLTIENPVIDQTKTLGIRIQNVNKWGVVQILQPYVGPATGDGISVVNCDGHVGIQAGLVRMNVSTAGKGISFDGCRSPIVNGTHIAECTTQALQINNVQGGSFEPVIQNSTATCSAAVQSVALVTKCFIRPLVNGEPGKVSIAHQSLNANNQNNVISLVGVANGLVSTLQSYAAGAELGSTFPESDTIIARKTAAQAMTVAAQTAITDLSVNLVANASYDFECVLNITAASGTSPTIAIGLTGPAGAALVSIRRDQMTAATTVATAILTAFGAPPAGGTPVANTVHILKGTIVNGVNAGAVAVTATMGGTTPSATIAAGSHIILTRTSVT